MGMTTFLAGPAKFLEGNDLLNASRRAKSTSGAFCCQRGRGSDLMKITHFFSTSSRLQRLGDLDGNTKTKWVAPTAAPAFGVAPETLVRIGVSAPAAGQQSPS
jgi:hypothetical protein